MPHIHTEPGHHDLTTTAFIVRTDGRNAYGLMHRHRKLGMLLPVGGHVELIENPWAAVIHEIKEESGYDINQLTVLQPVERVLRMDGVKSHPVPLFLQTHRFSPDAEHYHVDVGFAFITSQQPVSPPSEGESSELLWLTNDDIQARKNEMPADVAQIFDFVLTTAVKSWQRVSPSAFDV